MSHQLHDYHYDLPESYIAQTPHDPADECRLMVRSDDHISHHRFIDIVELIDPETVVILNNTKVIKARIPLVGWTLTNTLGHSKILDDGEIFFLTMQSEKTFGCLVRPGKKLSPGVRLSYEDCEIEIGDLTDTGRVAKICSDQSIWEILEQYGQMPLPPYISYDESKVDDYQTHRANQPGSVAAPTASLHITPRVLQGLRDKWVIVEYITLHVGLGTFKWIDTEDIRDYDIHPETVQVDIALYERITTYKRQGKKVLCVGTTATRALESLHYLYDQDHPNSQIISSVITSTTTIQFATKLYLTPGCALHLVDEMITNFHLPQSSLMVLVATMMGYETLMQCYHTAISQGYHFYSFGDAMWIRSS